MKNIFVLPIHKSIYITSEENINPETDWIISSRSIAPIKAKNFAGVPIFKWYKIILTTDQELIKDGIQAIPDDFLEWFVKNPSCKEVEIIDYQLHFGSTIYKIIIPKEESKQETSYSKEESFENKFLKWWMSLSMEEQVKIGFKYDEPTFNLTLRAIMFEFEQFKK